MISPPTAIAHDDLMTTDHELLQHLHEGLEYTSAADAHLLLAVSGGPDSVALLRGLLALRDERRLTLTVAHYNHRFRGPEADGDAQFVATLAESWAVPVVIKAAEFSGGSVREESARQVRYEFLEATAQQCGAGFIATGHTRDDQVETVLHHLFRGTGITGLQGIPRERSRHGRHIIRPLREVSRTLVLDFLAQIGQDYRADASNDDVRLTRNWLRHELLPKVRERFPQVDAAVVRMSSQAADTAELTNWIGRQLLQQGLVRREPRLVELSIGCWQDYPRAAWRAALVQLWMEQGWPRQEMSYERWEQLAVLAAADSGAITLPGNIEARKVDAILTIRPL